MGGSGAVKRQHAKVLVPVHVVEYCLAALTVARGMLGSESDKFAARLRRILMRAEVNVVDEAAERIEQLERELAKVEAAASAAPSDEIAEAARLRLDEAYLAMCEELDAISTLKRVCVEQADEIARLRAERDAANAALAEQECICKGNWRAIVKATEPLLGKRFKDKDGDEYTLFGIVHGDDDYYYGMIGKGLRLLSCVGNLEGHGFTAIDTTATERARKS